MRLENKSALITSGRSVIGLATGKRFIGEGARVVVTGRDEAVFDRVKAELGENSLVLKGDVRSLKDMRTISAQVKEKFDGLDVVFANAGWAFPSAVNDIDEALYAEIMDVNVKGVVFTLQYMLPVLRDGASVILNTSFVDQTGKHGISLTAAAKAAVRSLARSWSYEFLDRKTRFNVIAPGAIETPLKGSYPIDRPAGHGKNFPNKTLGRTLYVTPAIPGMTAHHFAFPQRTLRLGTGSGGGSHQNVKPSTVV
ncbi:Short-chain dehydrogenase/reductase SDR [Pandoraea communis]|uniref:Short-chain dehydrogenase/reductase SDR n=1 Tax=Pandoraea communis TaxID=2508297 RepID=A0A5E4XTU0_9BURK|nr:SDR family oxidoreductase [Pandoraea communis]VVE39495.1 Short-chain dehydrogenase/reductase SDR [Pandoraea communis]